VTCVPKALFRRLRTTLQSDNVCIVRRLVRPRRPRATLPVFMVPYRITPNRTEQRRWSWLVRSWFVPDGGHRTVRFWCNLAVWLQFRPKTLVFFLQQLFKYKTAIVNQESSTASDFEFPCKSLLGPSPKLMQPQPSLRVVQKSVVWRQRVRGYAGGGNGRFWSGEAFLRPLLHWQCQLGPYCTPDRI